MKRLLAYFAHGPLMFWLIGTTGLAVLLGLAYTTGQHNSDPLPPAASINTMQGDVAAWRSSLNVLPVVATSDDQTLITSVGMALGQAAHAAGTRAGHAGWSQLADTWAKAEHASLELAGVDVADRDRLVAAVLNVGIAGDRLVSAAVIQTSGTPEMAAIRGVPLGGQASGISGTGTWTGGGTPAQPEGATNGPADIWMQQQIP